MAKTEEYDRLSDLKAFDETKAGVKGLVDAGIKEIPRIFHHKFDDSDSISAAGVSQATPRVPIIDLGGRREDIIEEVREASRKWGFFQIVNHGIEERVLEEMIRGTRRFHEQDTETKKEFYTRDLKKAVRFNSNFDLYTGISTNWRDSFSCDMAPNPPDHQDIPSCIREILLEYSEKVTKVGILVSELMSEALRLRPSHLKEIGCVEGLSIFCHYYPPCPEPELTMGTTKHADNDFLTILLQDHTGGLQIRNDNQWIDVPPQPGALIVNVGDLMQLITNDAFKSSEHRVLASFGGPRISVASFFYTGFSSSPRVYRPITELLENHAPKYRETTVKEFCTYFVAKGLDEKSTLDHFKL